MTGATTLTVESLAAMLNGREYGRSIVTKEESQLAKAAGLVIVHGASDDLMEFRGAIYDEVGYYNGGTARVDAKGLLPDRFSIEDDSELEGYFARLPHAKSIDAIWAAEAGYSWTYRTTIPHATFEIVEDGEPYCRGIVFKLADAGTPEPLTMPAGWVFNTADFSGVAAGTKEHGAVLLVRDRAGRDAWSRLPQEVKDSDDAPDLYISGGGKTLDEALQDAFKNALAAKPIPN